MFQLMVVKWHFSDIDNSGASIVELNQLIFSDNIIHVNSFEPAAGLFFMEFSNNGS